MPESVDINYDTKIPNNVGLSSDRRVLKALERWHPGYLDWWNTMGPDGFQDVPVYLRTAVSVYPTGWAKFDYVKMPDYRWGILLAPQEEDRTIPFGQHKGEPAWQQIPGEYRAMFRRLMVIQGDTEPASVEQQRFLGRTAPSLYDMRNLFQVNVEEGRHLWAMVYLLQKYFGRDGREEAQELLRRRSGDRDAPRLLGAFNEETPDWLSFFMFTFFTDRDGKMQLESANAFNAGVKGRYRETKIDDDHQLDNDTYPVLKRVDGASKLVDEPALTTLNMRLRDDYVKDCTSGTGRWNTTIENSGVDFRLDLPYLVFHREIGSSRLSRRPRLARS